MPHLLIVASFLPSQILLRSKRRLFAMSTIAITAAEKSRGQYLHEPKALKLESRKLAPLASDEILISIRSTTICGSDIHYYTHFRNGSIQAREAAGQVVAVGSKVSQASSILRVGDAVALECGVPCGECAHCHSGRYNICPDLRFRSSASKFPHYQGTLQEFVVHPARWVHRLPPELDFEAGALLEPLAVAIHAVRRAGSDKVSPRRACLVFGAGAVGLLCAIAVRAEGCHDVVMVDIDEGRLRFALEHGFASVVYAVKPKSGETLEDKLGIAQATATAIGELKWPGGEAIGRVQRTFECTGAESCLQSSIYVSNFLCQTFPVG
jgi:L-iditol 2-dehydrogenase